MDLCETRAGSNFLWCSGTEQSRFSFAELQKKRTHIRADLPRKQAIFEIATNNLQYSKNSMLRALAEYVLSGAIRAHGMTWGL